MKNGSIIETKSNLILPKQTKKASKNNTKIVNKRTITVRIDNGVEEIAPYEFEEYGYDTFFLPESVKKIGAGAFYWSKLETLYIENERIKIAKDAFLGCKKFKYVYINGKFISMENFKLFYLEKYQKPVIKAKKLEDNSDLEDECKLS